MNLKISLWLMCLGPMNSLILKIREVVTNYLNLLFCIYKTLSMVMVTTYWTQEYLANFRDISQNPVFPARILWIK